MENLIKAILVVDKDCHKISNASCLAKAINLECTEMNQKLEKLVIFTLIIFKNINFIE